MKHYLLRGGVDGGRDDEHPPVVVIVGANVALTFKRGLFRSTCGKPPPHRMSRLPLPFRHAAFPAIFCYNVLFYRHRDGRTWGDDRYIIPYPDP